MTSFISWHPKLHAWTLVFFMSSTMIRSSHQRFSVKKVFLLNFIKKRPQHRCFPMKYAKLLRTSNLKNNSKRLLLFYKPTSIFLSKEYDSEKCKDFRETKFLGQCHNKHLNLLWQAFQCNNLRWSSDFEKIEMICKQHLGWPEQSVT